MELMDHLFTQLFCDGEGLVKNPVLATKFNRNENKYKILPRDYFLAQQRAQKEEVIYLIPYTCYKGAIKFSL